MGDTSRDSASTAENTPTPQGGPGATIATQGPWVPYSPQDCGAESLGDFSHMSLGGSDGAGEFWLTQYGWEKSMGLPPLTRRNNGVGQARGT